MVALGDGSSSGREDSTAGVCLAGKTAGISVGSTEGVLSPSIVVVADTPLPSCVEACSGRFIGGGNFVKPAGVSSSK